MAFKYAELLDNCVHCGIILYHNILMDTYCIAIIIIIMGLYLLLHMTIINIVEIHNCIRSI